MQKGKYALYIELKQKILTMEFDQTHSLDELSLSDQYHISRTPTREVLRLLAGEGYIEIEERRGARVKPLKSSTISNLISVAPMIYSAIGRLAVRNVLPAQIQDLKQAQQRFRKALSTRDMHGLIIEEHRFHSIIGQMSSNHYLKPSYERLLIDDVRMSHNLYRLETSEMDARRKLAAEHHDIFIESIEMHDEDSIVKLIPKHFELSRQAW
ncbi:putative HTH-type transcriptional regulator YdfH [compost metagenome]